MKILPKALAVLAGVVVMWFVSLLVLSWFSNWHAERRARDFCDAISLGSAISTVVAIAKKENVLWGHRRFYSFLFPGSAFDKAVCEVEVDQDGKVLKKGFVLLHD